MSETSMETAGEGGQKNGGRSPVQKLKLLYLLDYLMQETDEEHPASMADLIASLARNGIEAQRKSIYSDLEALRTYGADVVQTGGGRNTGYYIGSRTFEMPELIMLVDSVQSSRFLTRRKTETLVSKLETLCSKAEAMQLRRQIFVRGQIKTINESIYYNMDAIARAIAADRQIRFHYYQINVHKERVLRRDGGYYEASPFAMTTDNANYYLLSYDTDIASIRHFRVDKMGDIEMLQEPRQGRSVFEALDLDSYVSQVFGMYAGPLETVTIRFAEHLAGAVVDRLGQDITLVPDNWGQFTVTTSVVTSPQFFAWLFGFGNEAQLLGPRHVVLQLMEYIEQVHHMYESAIYHTGG